MDKPTIAIKVKKNEFNGVLGLGETVRLKMYLNPNFINPQPTLLVLGLAVDQMTDTMTKWGTVGHRGSHSDYVNLVGKANRLHALLVQLGKWCMSTIDADLSYDEQAGILLSSGFPLKSSRKPQGVLPMVQNFRRVLPFNLTLEQVKLQWSKPLAVATSTNVKGYKIYRNSTNNFETAVCIEVIPSTSYIDEPGAGTWYYWVVASNNKRNGVVSESVLVKIA